MTDSPYVAGQVKAHYARGAARIVHDWPFVRV